MLIAAGMNWHLFDTIDIVRFSDGDTVHLPTSVLRTASLQHWSDEQLEVPGVPRPSMSAQRACSYGIIEGTNIGYIYVWIWQWNAEAEFDNAIAQLQGTDGLIIDFRLNYGGNMFMSNPGLRRLFERSVMTIDFAARCSTDKSAPLCARNMGSNYAIPGAQPGYDKPLAVLTGPGALSSGDQVAFRMKYHPRARLFGKSTATAFNSPVAATMPNGWRLRYAASEAYALSNPSVYLTGVELAVDTAVWHTREAVAQGRDNVVEAARAWIEGSRASIEASSLQTGAPEIRPNPARERTELSYRVQRAGKVTVTLCDVLQRSIATIVDDERTPGTFTTSVDTEELAGGVYYVRVRTPGHSSSTRFVVIE